MASPVVQLRVPEDMLAAVDEARGDQSRSAWFLAAGQAALDGAQAAAAGPVRVVADDRVPAGTAALHSGTQAVVMTNLAPSPARGRSGRGDCPHPPARRAKGLCNACGQGGL